jgi:hypothetical protein
MTETHRKFQDWSRVADADENHGVIVWDSINAEYAVLWDEDGWDYYTPGEAKAKLKEAT